MTNMLPRKSPDIALFRADTQIRPYIGLYYPRTFRNAYKALGFIVVLIFFALFFPSSVEAEKILIVAPHPDDETIALGGWIFDRLKAGDDVQVILLTDGARFTKALRARRLKPSFFFRPHDFRTLGRIRRTEAAKALKELGIPSNKCFFLAYPSGSLYRIFQSKKADQLFRCPALAQRYGISEWQGAKRSPRPFSREAICADLDEIIAVVRPDVCVLPLPQDSNTDHRAANGFMLERLKKSGLHPRIMGYLVHFGSRYRYPRPFGYHPSWLLSNPAGLPDPRRYLPSIDGEKAKEKAIRRHRSQIRLKDGFLLSFIRREEIWWDIR